jgi:leucyl aminopeptidase
MKIRLLPEGAAVPRSPLVACFAVEGSKLSLPAPLDRLGRAAAATGDVRHEFRKTALFRTADERWPRLLVVGLGRADEATVERVRRAAAIAQTQAEDLGVPRLLLAADAVPAELPAEAVGRAVAEGLVLGAYRYAAPAKKTASRRHAQEATIVRRAATEFARGVALGDIGAAATAFARDLAHAPGNTLTPTRLAAEARKLAGVRVRVRVLERRDLQRLQMGAFLGVANGSAQPPKLIVLDYAPPGAKRTVCVVGKGLTFDSGGISIKPAAKMEDMRYDMCGGAAVLGLFHAIRRGGLARARQKVRVVGLVPATENMPGGAAQRPGDVVRACDGTTIEVLNTDAEGRLVLADAMAWAKKTYQPDAIVDLATLTGAVVVALGHEVSAVLGSDDDLIQSLIAAGRASDEPIWQLPLLEVHKNLNRSKFADLANLPSPSAGAGTIAAAAFLQHFAAPTPWAHLDIAGTAWGAEAKDYYTNGATGVGVRTLLQWLLR